MKKFLTLLSATFILSACNGGNISNLTGKNDIEKYSDVFEVDVNNINNLYSREIESFDDEYYKNDPVMNDRNIFSSLKRLEVVDSTKNNFNDKENKKVVFNTKNIADALVSKNWKYERLPSVNFKKGRGVVFLFLKEAYAKQRTKGFSYKKISGRDYQRYTTYFGRAKVNLSTFKRKEVVFPKGAVYAKLHLPYGYYIIVDEQNPIAPNSFNNVDKYMTIKVSPRSIQLIDVVFNGKSKNRKIDYASVENVKKKLYEKRIDGVITTNPGLIKAWGDILPEDAHKARTMYKTKNVDMNNEFNSSNPFVINPYILDNEIERIKKLQQFNNKYYGK